jgi:hypothetical protein
MLHTSPMMMYCTGQPRATQAPRRFVRRGRGGDHHDEQSTDVPSRAHTLFSVGSAGTFSRSAADVPGPNAPSRSDDQSCQWELDLLGRSRNKLSCSVASCNLPRGDIEGSRLYARRAFVFQEFARVREFFGLGLDDGCSRTSKGRHRRVADSFFIALTRM